MLIKIKKASDVQSSEIVRQNFYVNRRNFLTTAAHTSYKVLVSARGKNTHPPPRKFNG